MQWVLQAKLGLSAVCIWMQTLSAAWKTGCVSEKEAPPAIWCSSSRQLQEPCLALHTFGWSTSEGIRYFTSFEYIWWKKIPAKEELLRRPGYKQKEICLIQDSLEELIADKRGSLCSCHRKLQDWVVWISFSPCLIELLWFYLQRNGPLAKAEASTEGTTRKSCLSLLNGTTFRLPLTNIDGVPWADQQGTEPLFCHFARTRQTPWIAKTAHGQMEPPAQGESSHRVAHHGWGSDAWYSYS